MTTESPMTEMETRIVRRVRHQFRCYEIKFAGWETTAGTPVATFRVPDPVVASRMRDRGFRVAGVHPEVLVEPLVAPTPDRGVEMFRRFCLVALVMAALVVAWVVFHNGGGQ